MIQSLRLWYVPHYRDERTVTQILGFVPRSLQNLINIDSREGVALPRSDNADVNTRIAEMRRELLTSFDGIGRVLIGPIKDEDGACWAVSLCKSEGRFAGREYDGSEKRLIVHKARSPTYS